MPACTQDKLQCTRPELAVHRMHELHARVQHMRWDETGAATRKSVRMWRFAQRPNVSEAHPTQTTYVDIASYGRVP